MNQKRKSSLVDRAFPGYSGMIIAASLASTVSSFVDGIITGKLLGSEAMAAFGIALPFVLILAVVMGMILSSGGCICSSKAIGSNQREKANSNFTACLILGLAAGAAGAVICFAFPRQLITLTGAEGSLAEEAAAYLRGYGFGTIPTILLTILMNYADLDGNENLAFLAVIVMTVADILLDLILGVKLAMGLFGMALATSASYLLSVAVFLGGYLRGKSLFSLSFRNIGPEMADILKTGYPSALNTLLVSIRCFFLNSILMSVAGSDAVSAYSFQSNFNQIFLAFATGISTSVSVLTGIFIGEKDRERIRTTVRCGFRNGIFLSAILMAVMLLGGSLITSLLLDGSAQCLAYATAALRLYSLSMPVSIVCITLISYYQTTGDRKTANTIAIGHGLVLPLGCAYLFSALIGLNGVWISTLIAECLALVILAVILKFRTGKMPAGLEGLAVIRSDAFPAEESVFSCSAETKALDTDALCTQLGEFLAGRHCDGRTWEQLRSAVSRILDAGKTDAGIVDIQSYSDADGVRVHLRFDGRKMDKLLNSPEWQKETGKENKAGSPACAVSSHYSAGISFAEVRKG